MGFLLRGSRAAHTRFVRVFHALVCCGVAFGFRASVSAAPVALSWEAPTSCAEAAAVETKIQGLLGAESDTHTQVRARVQIALLGSRGGKQGERTRARYRLRLWLTVGARHAQRTLYDESCDELTDTVAWLVALAVDPDISQRANDDSARVSTPEARASGREQAGVASGVEASTSGREQKTEAKNGQAAPKQGAPDASRDQAAAETPKSPPKPIAAGARDVTEATLATPAGPPLPKAGHAGVGAGMFSGGPGGVQAAVGAFAGLSVGWSYTQARFSGLLPRSVEIAADASAQIASLELDLTQCALAGTRVRAGPCLSLAGLRTSANAKGLSGASGNAALWAIASAGLTLFWRVGGHMELSLAGSVGIPISPRPQFTVEDVGPVVEAKAWSSDLRIGISFASP